jgi:hypothetical protein
MLLPNSTAVNRNHIAEKVHNYCLNDNHEKGKHKALLFRHLLGITQENSEILTQAIFEASQNESAVFVKSTPYCDLYNIVFLIATSNGAASIRTGWCVHHETNIPHLTTAFIE